MSSIGGTSSDTAEKQGTTGETGKMIRLDQPDASWGEQLLKVAADLAGTVHDGSDSELSDTDHFLTKGAFLLTPSHELSIEKASSICEKMNFKGLFSLTKTATGILFRFSDPEDYQAVFKKGFHKVTNARYYKKVSWPTLLQLGIFRFSNARFAHLLGSDVYLMHKKSTVATLNTQNVPHRIESNRELFSFALVKYTPYWNTFQIKIVYLNAINVSCYVEIFENIRMEKVAQWGAS
jgi:hypothetical protein